MTKAELRLKYKLLRSQLSQKDIEQMSIEIANQLLNLSIWEFSYYHLFLSIVEKKEINTDFILHILQGKDKNVVVPKSILSSNTLSHFLLMDNTVIKKNSYGIPEPADGIEIPVEKLDVVFIPLMAFDEQGNRVGYGKGFYDRFLSNCKPETLKIGLSFFEAEKESIIGITKDDIQLDYCVTSKSIFSFN